MSNAFFQWQPEGGSHALQQEYWETGAYGCIACTGHVSGTHLRSSICLSFAYHFKRRRVVLALLWRLRRDPDHALSGASQLCHPSPTVARRTSCSVNLLPGTGAQSCAPAISFATAARRCAPMPADAWWIQRLGGDMCAPFEEGFERMGWLEIHLAYRLK